MNNGDTDIPVKDLWSIHVGGHHRGPRAGGLDNRSYFLTVRRLEVQGQGVGRDGFFGGSLLGLQMPSPPHVLRWSSLRVRLRPNQLFF